MLTSKHEIVGIQRVASVVVAAQKRITKLLLDDAAIEVLSEGWDA